MCFAFIHLPASIQDEIDSNFFGPTLSQTKTTVDWFQEFINSKDVMYFKYNYPMISITLQQPYKDLVNRIFYEIQEYCNSISEDRVLPNWIYSYMIGIAIGPNSDKYDIHDMIYSMGVDNLEDDYNALCASTCLKLSTEWLKKFISLDSDIRPPTMFGEPHVLKYIRLIQESIGIEDLPVV